MILVKKRDEKKYMVYKGWAADCSDIEDLSVYFDSSEEEAIKKLYSEDSGDVIILTNFEEGYDVYSPPRIGYCCLKNCDELLRSDHGSILESDRLIPFVIFGEPVKGKSRVISEPKNQVDVAPTIAGILGFTMPEADGKNILASQ